MDLKSFALRNRIPLLQSFAIVFLFVAGIVMLQMSVSSSAPQNPSQNSVPAWQTSFPEPNLTGEVQPVQPQPENCTPLSNATAKISFAYRVESYSSEGETEIFISRDYIGTDTTQGIPVDIVETTVNASMSGMRLEYVSRAWLDSENGACIKAELKTGATFLPYDCSRVMSGFPVVRCKEELYGFNLTADEEIVVPAGRFTAAKYNSGNDVIWLAPGVPVPIKFSSTNAGVVETGELLRYSGG